MESQRPARRTTDVPLADTDRRAELWKVSAIGAIAEHSGKEESDDAATREHAYRPQPI
jgi:hypothetical protein